MNEEVTFILDTTKESMEGSISHLEKALVKIRAGKASPVMLSTVMVEYYGSPTPLVPGIQHQYPGCAYHFRATVGKVTSSRYRNCHYECQSGF